MKTFTIPSSLILAAALLASSASAAPAPAPAPTPAPIRFGRRQSVEVDNGVVVVVSWLRESRLGTRDSEGAMD